nr:MAG TPA: hypothetical protein [Caudoviricetes sp.]
MEKFILDKGKARMEKSVRVFKYLHKILTITIDIGCTL